MDMQQLRASKPQADKIISEYIVDENVKNPLLQFVEWLNAKGVFPLYTDFEGQDPFWEITYKDKTHFIVWNGKENMCIMLKVAFTSEVQAVIVENNLQDIVLENLQYCSRSSGGECNNCHIPSHVAGVDEVIFGKEIKNLCCGQFISFNNPNKEIIEGIKKLIEL
jgi:hypothetical protein